MHGRKRSKYTHFNNSTPTSDSFSKILVDRFSFLYPVWTTLETSHIDTRLTKTFNVCFLSFFLAIIYWPIFQRKYRRCPFPRTIQCTHETQTKSCYLLFQRIFTQQLFDVNCIFRPEPCFTSIRSKENTN